MLWIFMTVAALAVAHAGEDCGTVRLDAPGQAFAKIPVFDQSKGDPWDPNICYAIVAAQLRDADRFAKGDPLDRLSAPLSIALNYKAHLRNSGLDHKGYDTESDNERMIGPGSPRAAILLNNGRSVCDLKFLDQYASVVRGQTFEGTSTTAEFLFDVNREMNLIRMDAKKRRSLENFEKEFPCENCRRSSLDRVKNLLEVVDKAIPEGQRYVEEARQVLDKLCEEHASRSTVAPPRYVVLKSPARLRPELDQGLDSKVPVGIAYCHEFLQDNVKCPAGHTSVVIGRQKIDGECRYLIRDSYGPGCKTRFKCEPDGSIWVPAKELGVTATQLFYIPPK